MHHKCTDMTSMEQRTWCPTRSSCVWIIQPRCSKTQNGHSNQDLYCIGNAHSIQGSGPDSYVFLI